MNRFQIAPALEPEEWKHRRCGPVSLDQVDGETHVVVTDPDGELVSVSGPAEVFALMALANDALPDGDPRKICRTWIELIHDVDSGSRAQIASALGALLPPETVQT